MNNRIFGYARVSSKDQNEARQLEAFLDCGIDERDIFVDKASGKDFEREQYSIMKKMLRENDLLIIKSIDRLGRNYDMIIEEWRDITKNIGADIKVLDMPMLDTSNKNELIGKVISDIVLQLLSYVAEQERTYIKQRQKEGIIAAKNKGIKLGRPKVLKPKNFDYIVALWRDNELTTKEALEELNLKTNTFYNFLKEC